MMEEQTMIIFERGVISTNCQMILPELHQNMSSKLGSARGVNSYGRSSGVFDSSVSESTSRRGVATSRGPIPFENGDEMKEPKSI